MTEFVWVEFPILDGNGRRDNRVKLGAQVAATQEFGQFSPVPLRIPEENQEGSPF